MSFNVTPKKKQKVRGKIWTSHAEILVLHYWYHLHGLILICKLFIYLFISFFNYLYLNSFAFFMTKKHDKLVSTIVRA